jgi:hypothetical protein
MSESQAESPTQLRIHAEPSAAPPAPIYSNYVQATFTPEDFTLHLGWYAIPAFTEAPTEAVVDVPVTPVARIVLPLNIMRSLIAVLERQVENYEQSFGPIPDHPNKPDWLKGSESDG